MPFEDSQGRGRLLTESSTRAFAALRALAMAQLSRLRLAALVAFTLVNAAFAAAGDRASRSCLLPLVLYALGSYPMMRWAQRGRGLRKSMAMASPVLDLVFVFLLLWLGAPSAQSLQFNAGWAVGFFALLV